MKSLRTPRITIAGLLIVVAAVAVVCSRYSPLTEDGATREAVHFMVKMWPDSRMEQCETQATSLPDEKCWKIEFRERGHEWGQYYVKVHRDGHCEYVSTFTCVLPAAK
jgi:hypothetical protein